MINLDKASPGVEVQFRGVVSTLKFNFATISRAEKYLNKSIMQGDFLANLDSSSVAVLLWAALSKNHKDLTVEELLEELSIDQMEDIGELLQALISQSEAKEADLNEISEKKTETQAEPIVESQEIADVGSTGGLTEDTASS